MTPERAKELQELIAKEAIALMVIHGEYMSNTTDEDDISVTHFEKAIVLIGKACALPEDTTEKTLALIQQEREVTRRIAAGQEADHTFPEEELPINATGMVTLDNVWGLFEAAVQLDSQEEREALFKLANELAECQNLLDWIEKTPEERRID